MFFNGKDADFNGKVQAVQENSKMLCATLQVTLDRVVNFKEGQKGGQAAKVEKLVADRDVSVEEKVEQDGKFVKFNRMVCRSLAMDNKDGPVNAAGPGIVYLLQYGAVDNDLAGPAPVNEKPRSGASAKPQMELKLTRIEFEGRMFSNSKRATRIAKFWDKVEVINGPCPTGKIDMPFDKDQVPERGMYLSCEVLTVTSTPQKNGPSNQTLYAEKNVLVKTPETMARAATVTFEELKNLIIFIGKEGTPATFYRGFGSGKDPQGFKGQKIFYNRRTKQHWGEGLQSISYNSGQ
jgi:hypothetical protein